MISGTPASIAAEKGHQFLLREAFARAVEARQVEVRVHGRVAVAGEMFGAGEDSFCGEAIAEMRRPGARLHAGRRRSCGPACHRAVRIGGEIQHGREIEIHAGGAQFTSDGARDPLDERCVAQAA